MTLVAELHQDHINLSKLLDILASKSDKLKEGGDPSFSLISDVIDYIANYAEQNHHPREDRMYEYFKGRDTKLDIVMEKCLKEHEMLKGSGHQLLDVIDGILHDSVLPMEQFIEKLDAFVKNERRHLDLEEAEIFPLIEAIAMDKDWAALQEMIPAVEDPLFGERQADAYKALFKELMIDLNS